jgi:hypothetical protein
MVLRLMVIYFSFPFFLMSLIEGHNPIVNFANIVLLVSAGLAFLILSEVTWYEISKSKLGPGLSYNFSVLGTRGIQEGEGVPL